MLLVLELLSGWLMLSLLAGVLVAALFHGSTDHDAEATELRRALRRKPTPES